MRQIPVLARDGGVRGYALVDDEDYDELRQYTWRLHSQGYVCRAAATVLMHRQVMGVNGGREINVDHWNTDKLDNRRENLRVTTVAQNGQNRRGANSNGHIGVRGVGRVKWGNKLKFRARVCVGRQEVHCTYHDTVEEATVAVIAARAQHMPYSQEAAQLQEM